MTQGQLDPIQLMRRIDELENKIDAMRTIEVGGVWQDWTPIQTGWTALPVGAYRYCQIGKQVTLAISMSSGTSNATSAILSLPTTAATVTDSIWMGACGILVNNGSVLTVAGRWRIESGGTIVEFYTNMSTGAWTASGSKRVYCVATYEAA